MARLPREPGRREVRYTHLFSGEPPAQESAPSAMAADAGGGTEAGDTLAQRIARIEEEVRQLRAELQELKSQGRPLA